MCPSGAARSARPAPRALDEACASGPRPSPTAQEVSQTSGDAPSRPNMMCQDLTDGKIYLGLDRSQIPMESTSKKNNIL